MKSYSFLFWAYNVIWIGLAVYLFLLFLRLKRMGRRLDGLERVMRTAVRDDQESSGS